MILWDVHVKSRAEAASVSCSSRGGLLIDRLCARARADGAIAPRGNLPPAELLPQLFTDLYPHFPQIHLTPPSPPPARSKAHAALLPVHAHAHAGVHAGATELTAVADDAK